MASPQMPSLFIPLLLAITFPAALILPIHADVHCLVARPGFGLVSEQCPQHTVACRIRIEHDAVSFYEYSPLYDRNQFVCVLKGEFGDQHGSGCVRKRSGHVRCWCFGRSNCNTPENSKLLFGTFVGGNELKFLEAVQQIDFADLAGADEEMPKNGAISWTTTAIAKIAQKFVQKTNTQKKPMASTPLPPPAVSHHQHITKIGQIGKKGRGASKNGPQLEDGKGGREGVGKGEMGMTGRTSKKDNERIGPEGEEEGRLEEKGKGEGRVTATKGPARESTTISTTGSTEQQQVQLLLLLSSSTLPASFPPPPTSSTPASPHPSQNGTSTNTTNHLRSEYDRHNRVHIIHVSARDRYEPINLFGSPALQQIMENERKMLHAKVEDSSAEEEEEEEDEEDEQLEEDWEWPEEDGNQKSGKEPGGHKKVAERSQKTLNNHSVRKSRLEQRQRSSSSASSETARGDEVLGDEYFDSAFFAPADSSMALHLAHPILTFAILLVPIMPFIFS